MPTNVWYGSYLFDKDNKVEINDTINKYSLNMSGDYTYNIEYRI